MNRNYRIFHSNFYIEGFSAHRSRLLTANFGKCTFVCRRKDSESETMDIAIAFCNSRDVFKKKEGVRVALAHLEAGNYVTIPVNQEVEGKYLNDVIRSFMSRDSTEDYRHIVFGTTPNLPVKNWDFVEYLRRF